MPRVAINYDNVMLYKIVCRDISINSIYVGHTTNFIRRRNAHKTRCNNTEDPKNNLKLYRFIRENGGWGNFDMILIEQCMCENKLQACKKEREYIEQLQATLNINRPFITAEETQLQNQSWKDNHKDRILLQQKTYRRAHREQLRQYKEKNKETLSCECGGCFVRKGEARHNRSLNHQRYLENKNKELS